MLCFFLYINGPEIPLFLTSFCHLCAPTVPFIPASPSTFYTCSGINVLGADKAQTHLIHEELWTSLGEKSHRSHACMCKRYIDSSLPHPAGSKSFCVKLSHTCATQKRAWLVEMHFTAFSDTLSGFNSEVWFQNEDFLGFVIHILMFWAATDGSFRDYFRDISRD